MKEFFRMVNRVTAKQIYVPKILRKYVPTIETKSGTRLKQYKTKIMKNNKTYQELHRSILQDETLERLHKQKIQVYVNSKPTYTMAINNNQYNITPSIDEKSKEIIKQIDERIQSR